MSNAIVYSSGGTPSDLVITGESPGIYEARVGEPFVGPSGEILSMILAHCGDHPPYNKSSIYITNLVKEHRTGNPDPTYEQIIQWGDTLRLEILACRPKVIICAGRFSSWWFLGGWGKWGMRTIHGRVCRSGELVDVNSPDMYDYPEASSGMLFDDIADMYRERSNGALIVPCFHPANALPSRDPKGDMMGVVWRDFDTAIRAYEQLRFNTKFNKDIGKGAGRGCAFVPADDYQGDEKYIDATGAQVAEYIARVSSQHKIIAVDTEDTDDPLIPWTIQICSDPGYALTLRIDQPDAEVGIDAIQQAINYDYLIILHFAIHDLPVMRKLGIDTSRINMPKLKTSPDSKLFLGDTSYMLYLLAEPQSLKVAAWRHCGMIMLEYDEVIGDVAQQARLSYLLKVVINQYPRPGKLKYIESNGELKTYSPRSPTQKAERLIKDVKAGEDVDIWKRWHNVPASGHKARVIKELYRPVVDELGRMPYGSLKDVERTRAKYYECRDADATLRVFHALLPRLEEMGLA